MLQRINTEIGKKYIITINYSTPTTEFFYDPFMNVVGTLPSTRNLVDIEFLAVYNEYFLQTKGYSDPMTVSSVTLKEIPNLVTNGTLTNGTGWSAGTGCTFIDGVARVNNVAVVSGFSFCTQNTGGSVLSKLLRLTFEIKNYSSGSISVNAGGTVYAIPNTNSNGVKTFDYIQGVNANGHFSFYMYAGGTFVGDIDNIHLYEIPEWQSNGNHTINWTTRDKYTNSGSLLISSSGTGNTSSNYVSLPYANFDTLESTKKYTLEFWSKVDLSTLTYGSNLFTSSADSDANGLIDIFNNNNLAYWTNTYSVVSGSGFSGSAQREEVSAQQIRLDKANDGWGQNQITKLSFKYRSNKSVQIFQGGNILTTINANSGSASAYVMYNYNGAGNNGDIRFYAGGSASDYLEIGDFSVQRATLLPSITSSLGTKVSSNIINNLSWIKTVLNFEAGSTELSQDIKLNLNQSCSVYVDKLSLSQRYDLGLFAKFRMESSSKSYPTIIGFGGYGGPTLGGYWIYRSPASQIISQIQSYDYNAVGSQVGVALYGGAITDGQYNSINLVADGNLLKINKNGTYSDLTSIATLGKIIWGDPAALGIGVTSNTTANNMSGSISQVQIVRFDNIALSNWNSSSMDLQSVYNGGADEVLRLEFQNTNTESLFYRDSSPNKLTIVPNNVDMTNLVYINTGFNITSGSDKSQVVTDWDKELIVSQSLNTGSVYRLEFSYKGNGLVYVKNGNYTVASASANTSSFGYYEGTFLCTSPTVYMQASSGSWFEVDGLGLREIPNIVLNGTFGTTSNWSLGNGWSIDTVNKKAVHSAIDLIQMRQTNVFVAGKRYKISYEIIDMTTGSFLVEIGDSLPFGETRTTNGIYTDILTAGGTFLDMEPSADFDGSIRNVHVNEIPDWKSNGNHIIDQSTQYMYSGSFTGEITSTGTGSSSTNFVNLAYTEFDALAQNKKYILEFVARPSTSGLNLTIGIGANSKSFALTETSSWTSCIWNIDNYDNSFTNQDVKMWLNNSGSIWFDNLRLKQNYDLALVTAGKFSINTAYSGSWDLLIFGSETTDSSSVGYGLSYDNGYGIWGDFVDNNSNILTVSSSVIPDKYYDSIILVKDSYRDMNTSSLYIENQLINRNYGTLGLMDIPYEESGSINPSQGFKGWLGRTQIIRFDNISVSNFNPTTYRIGDIITGGGAEVVANYTWKDAVSESTYSATSDQLFYDKSSIRNDLSVYNINVSNIKSVPFNLITGSLIISRSSFNEQLITGNGYTLEFKTYASGNNAIPMDVTASIGTTTYAWTGISYNSASPSKLSYNFVATSSNINSDMIFQKSTPGVLNIYDISLAQTYDTTINVMLENNYDVVGRYLMYMEYDSGSFYIRKDVNEYTFSLGDVTFAVPSSSFGTGSWASVSYVHKVGSGTEVFVNGNSVLYDSSSKYLSSLKSVEYFVVGNDNVTASYTSAYSGKVGEIQMIRGYAYNSEDSLYLYENGFNYPRIGKIAFWYKWIEGSTEDIAGYNELTPYVDYNNDYGSYESVNNVRLRELFSQNYGIYYDYNDGYPYLYGNEYKFYTRNDVESYDGTSVIKVGRIFKIQWNSYY